MLCHLTFISVSSVENSDFAQKNKNVWLTPWMHGDKSTLYILWDGLFWSILCQGGKERAEAFRFAVHLYVYSCFAHWPTFINVLRTFIAVRGNVQQLRPDQGTNFIGAKQEFLEAFKEMNQECLNQLGCEFVMNPPSTSHMGGALERIIITIRSVLTFILDQSSPRLHNSTLRTYLDEVMAIINSRPLTAHLLNDPTGPQPLMPNHPIVTTGWVSERRPLSSQKMAQSATFGQWVLVSMEKNSTC